MGETEWHELRAALPDIAERTLRAAALARGVAIAQPWRGVLQHSFDELQDSLTALSAVYEQRPELRRYCRDQVIAAKDRARWQSKAEMTEWMLIWLGDPAMFPAWAEIRRRQMAEK